MLIKDKDFSFNSKQVSELSESDTLKARKLVYRRYVYIRQLVAGDCCQQPTVERLRELIKEHNNYERVARIYGYSKAETDCYLDLITELIPFIR